MRPLASVVPCARCCHAAVLPAQRLCSCTATPAAGLPRLVSSMCVVIGDRAGGASPAAQHITHRVSMGEEPLGHASLAICCERLT